VAGNHEFFFCRFWIITQHLVLLGNSSCIQFLVFTRWHHHPTWRFKILDCF